MSKPDFWEGYVPEPDKRQQALDKKAENARELGLDYEPAQQEPVACKTLCELCAKRGYSGCANAAQITPIPSPPAQQEPVAWIFKPHRELLWPNEVERKNPLELNEYAPLYTTPPAALRQSAQRPWLGLTDEEIKKLAAPLFMTHYWKLCNEFARAIEAKLKEKNNG